MNCVIRFEAHIQSRADQSRPEQRRASERNVQSFSRGFFCFDGRDGNVVVLSTSTTMNDNHNHDDDDDGFVLRALQLLRRDSFIYENESVSSFGASVCICANTFNVRF